MRQGLIKLRNATEDDLELMMAWRSNPLVYQGFYQQMKPLDWGEHLKWWQSRNKDWRTLIIEYEGRSIGVVTLGQLDHWNPEIGYYIGEVSLWGNGLGKQAVGLALDWLRSEGFEYTHTTVLKNNTRSMKLLKGLGFVVMGKAREGEVWMQRKL